MGYIVPLPSFLQMLKGCCERLCFFILLPSRRVLVAGGTGEFAR